MTHGPLKEKNYKRKISKKMRAQALFSVLSRKFKDGEIIFVDSLSLPAIKTRAAVEIINNLSAVLGRGKILAALYARNEKAEKSFRNLPRVEVSFVKNLNPVQALNHKYLLVENPEESVKFLASRGN